MDEIGPLSDDSAFCPFCKRRNRISVAEIPGDVIYCRYSCSCSFSFSYDVAYDVDPEDKENVKIKQLFIGSIAFIRRSIPKLIMTSKGNGKITNDTALNTMKNAVEINNDIQKYMVAIDKSMTEI